MKVYQFTHSQILPISQDIAWAFFSNPANLQQLTPPWMPMENISASTPKTCYPGLIQLYKIKLFRLIPSHWLSEITHVDAPHRFVDEQKAGPFTLWHHTHHLFPTASGSTRIQDTIYYALPLGPFAPILNRFIRPQLTALFSYRSRQLSDFFE
jgi:ligand-binding SRPBCC domain-containing protein